MIAKAIYAGCPVIACCLGWAIEGTVLYGIFRGMTPIERRAERKRRTLKHRSGLDAFPEAPIPLGAMKPALARRSVMELEVSTMIDRPVTTVWDFYAVHHVENHPRWDPDLELENTTDGPIRVETVIKRRVTRFGNTTEGTMEIIEFEPEKVIRVKTQDGSMKINGWALFAAPGENETKLTIGGEFPGMDDSMEEKIRPLIERSAANIKSLIESET